MRPLVKLLFLLFLLQLSCKNDVVDKSDLIINRSEENSNNQKTKKKTDGQKLFLTFREGISNKEFNLIANDLIKKKILEKHRLIEYLYVVGTCKVTLTPQFNENKLSEIKLEDAECLYQLFKEKYDLESLRSKNYFDYAYIENNPDYNPKLYYYDGNALITLPNAFIDNSTRLKPNKKIKLTSDLIAPQKTNILNKNPTTIQKDKVTIKIEQKIVRGREFIRYLLRDNEEMREYRTSKKGRKGLGLSGKEGEFLKTNSKLRTVKGGSGGLISITYSSRSRNEREEKLKEEEILRKKQQREKDIEENVLRLKSAMEEI